MRSELGDPIVSVLAAALLAELDDDALDALAEALLPRLAARLDQNQGASPWLSAEEAARHLACSRGRLYDLVQLGKLQPRRDGRRLLFRLAELDAYLEG
jgi:excisionase family DNA binding protein